MNELSQIQELAKGYNVIPVTRRLFGGDDTPLGLYQKLCRQRANTFLLESAEQGVWGRYSFIGVSSRGQLSSESGSAVWSSRFPALPQGELSEDPIEALAQLQDAWKAPELDFPLSSGLVGFASWRTVGRLERLAAEKNAGYEVPELCFNQFDSLVVLDHKTAETVLVVLIFMLDDSDLEYELREANMKLDELQAAASTPHSASFSSPAWPEPAIDSKTPKSDFIESIKKAKKHVELGDVFQVVISQRFDHDCAVDSAEVYRNLRAMNPSPYMYLTRWEDSRGSFDIVGSSPEALVKVTGNRVITHPIAGSRPRGSDSRMDLELANELESDAKEKSEHLMLVDLARNDLLKVCEPASVQVTEFMEIHKFSHIMHLVSTVEGHLLPELGPVDVLRATFPAGTLSGAPKPRALEIIHDLEPYGRGLFGGVVGYFDYSGNADLAIAIRTALIRDGKAYIQAGAGIVLDSEPEKEYQETIAKASVVLRAVAAANAQGKAK